MSTIMKRLTAIVAILGVMASPVAAEEILGYQTYGETDWLTHYATMVYLKRKGLRCDEPSANYWLNTEKFTAQFDVARDLIICANNRAYIHTVDQYDRVTVKRIK